MGKPTPPSDSGGRTGQWFIDQRGTNIAKLHDAVATHENCLTVRLLDLDKFGAKIKASMLSEKFHATEERVPGKKRAV